MDRQELRNQLRSWAQKHPRGSMERRLMHRAADELEAPEITVEAVEAALDGKLLPWQKKALGG